MNRNSKWFTIIPLLVWGVVACVPTHPGGELVELGVLKAEIKGTDELQVKQVWVHADAEGTHIHGKLQRKGYGISTSGHVEITLLDRDGKVVYQGSMKPSEWNVSPSYRKGSFVHDETFHVITLAPVPEQGTVRVVYHSGSGHAMKSPRN